MHAHHSGVQLIASVKGALAHQAVCHRGLNLVGKCPQLLSRIGQHCAAAHKDERLLGLADDLNGPLHVLLTDGVAMAHDFLRLLLLILAGGRRHILGDIHQNRTRTPCLGNGECPADDLCQPVHVLDNEIIFGNGHGHARNINLLETVLAQKAVGHIAGNGNHRHRVHVGGRNTRNQVGCPGSRGCQAHAHLARGPCITVRCMGSALLMGCKDMGNLILMLVQCVIYIQDGTARITEHSVHSLFLQTLNYNLCPRQFAHNYRTPFLVICSVPYFTCSTAPLSADVTRDAYLAR